MRSGTASWGAVVAVMVVGANLMHGLTHAGQHVVTLPAWQWAYIAVVIYLAPIAAASLLLNPRTRKAGAWLLFISTAGAFVFDLSYHFLIPGPDNVFGLPPGAWRTPFTASAVLVTLLSGAGALVGLRLLLDLYRSPAVMAAPVGDPAAPRPGPSTRRLR